MTGNHYGDVLVMEERASGGTDERQRMKTRTRIGLVLAMIAALFATVPGAGAQEGPPGKEPPPVTEGPEQIEGDLDPISVELAVALGRSDGSQSESRKFFGLSRRDQGAAIRATGVDDPGGDLLHLDAQLYVLGQLEMKRGDRNRGARQVLGSGHGDPKRNLELLSTLPAAAYSPSENMVDHVLSALPDLTKDEAREFARQQELAMDLRPILRALDDGYLALRVSPEADGLSYTTKSRRAQAMALVATVQGSEIRVEESEVSEADLLNEVDRVVGEVNSRGQALGKVEISTSKFPPRVTVKALEGSDSREVREALGSMRRNVPVHVEELSDSNQLRRSEFVPTLGGTTTGAGVCTWGFNFVRSGSNVNRLSTAAHCPNQQYFDGIKLPWAWQHQKLNWRTDMQQHKVIGSTPAGPLSPTNKIKTVGTATQTITSRGGWASLDVGDVVCHTGMITGWSCGTISSLTETSQRGTGNKWVKVDGPYYTSDGGDSGGPYVIGSKAVGTHESGNGVSGWFGPVNFAEIDLNITVRTFS